MENIKFAAYLAPEGLTVDEARDAITVLSDYIERFEMLTTIGSFVEQTRLKWESGGDGSLELTGEVAQSCMPPAVFKALPANLANLAMARALKQWLEKAVGYMQAVSTYNPVISIQATRNIYDVYSSLRQNDYLMELLIPLIPAPPKVKEPEHTVITQDDYLKSLSANDLARYYAAQAAAATVGDFVHPEGSFAKARIDLVDKIAHPCTVESNIKSTTVYRRIPAVPLEKVDDMYFDLQARQRDFQKDVNHTKFKAEEAVADSEQEHVEISVAAQTENKTNFNDYSNLIDSLVKQITSEASKLRIAVPTRARTFLDSLIKPTR